MPNFNPILVTRAAVPKVRFTPLFRQLFEYPMTLSAAARIRWPPQTGILSQALSALSDEEKGDISGYARRENSCAEHKGAPAHYCWDHSVVNDLLRELGKVPRDKDEVVPLEVIMSLDERLLPEWGKQLLFASQVRELFTACRRRGVEGEVKFREEHHRLHRGTWGTDKEIRGLPPADAPELENWRVRVPDAAFTGRLAEELEPVLLRDFPDDSLLPRHVAEWLVARVSTFRGVHPGYLWCFYYNSIPNLEQTRQFVLRTRMVMLGETVLECIVGEGMHIPDRLSAIIREAPVAWRYAGDTVEGMNQVISALLGLADEKGKPRGGDGPIVSTLMAWAATKAKNPQDWATKYDTLAEEGMSRLLLP